MRAVAALYLAQWLNKAGAKDSKLTEAARTSQLAHSAIHTQRCELVFMV